MKWLLALTATFAALVLVECALEVRYAMDSQTWREQHSPHYSFALHSTTGQRVSPLPGLLELELHAGSLYANRPDQSNAYFNIDASGFRAGAPAPQSPDARVFVVGGSTAFGTGLEGDAQTFPAQLAAHLPNTEVTNAAVIGYASGQELAGILLEILDHEPDLVIALNGVNDAMVSDYESERSYGPGFNGLSGMIEKPMQDLMVFTDPNPLRRLAFGLPRVLFPEIIRRLSDPWVPEGERASAKRAAEIYLDNMEKAHTILTAHDVNFLCALQPLRADADAQSSGLLARFRVLRQVARAGFVERGIHFVDLQGTKALQPEMFLDSMHLDARGNALLAKRVARAVMQRGLLPIE